MEGGRKRMSFSLKSSSVKFSNVKRAWREGGREGGRERGRGEGEEGGKRKPINTCTVNSARG